VDSDTDSEWDGEAELANLQDEAANGDNEVAMFLAMNKEDAMGDYLNDPSAGRVPEPERALTYPLKIFLTFLQISTSLGTGLEMQWPSTYKSFLLAFSWANFDQLWAQVSSTDCVQGYTYFSSFILIALMPAAVVLVALGAFVLPFSMRMLCFKHYTPARRTRMLVIMWKCTLYLLFLVSVMSLFVLLCVCRVTACLLALGQC
jgi:hypothetical protein